MANVVVFLAEGFEEIEGLATVDISREEQVILFIQLGHWWTSYYRFS